MNGLPTTSSSVFVFVFNILSYKLSYAMLSFRMIFFITCFALFLSLVNLQYCSPLLKIYLQFLFNESVCNELFALVLFSIIQDSLDYI